MAAVMRQTLATAIQRSSATASHATSGSDPNVGSVYVSVQSAAAGSLPSACPGQPQPPPFSAPFGAVPGQGFAPAQPANPGLPNGLAGDVAEHEKDREIERLKSELRKADEKSNFFRSQVMALQHQVTSMDRPVTAASGTGGLLGDEVARLRAELAEERAARQALHQAVQQGQGYPAPRGDTGPVDATTIAVLQARVAELEWELQAARAGLPGGASTASGPSGSAWPRVHSGNMGQSGAAATMVGMPPAGRSSTGWAGPLPAPSSPTTSSPHRTLSAPYPGGFRAELRGDPLDPGENPGGMRRALIVGCDYPNSVGALRAGVADAQQWARFFAKRCRIPEQDIRLLSDDPVHYKQQDRPDCALATRDNMMRALHWLVARVSSGDQLFFVFCGHGAQVAVDGFGHRRLCENTIVPTDFGADGEYPRLVSDADIHQALLHVPIGAQVTLIYDSCSCGNPLDRCGMNFLTEPVGRGRIDYERLRGRPVLPRFLDLPHWRPRQAAPECMLDSGVRCQAVLWSACTPQQFCVELPIEERPRGVFTYIFIQALLTVGVQSSSEAILRELTSQTAKLKGRWRLQQDAQMISSRSTSDAQPFFRF